MEQVEVYRAIVNVIDAMGKDGISKSRKNVQQGYSFRGIDDVYNALSSNLAAAKLCIIPRIVARESAERQTAKGGTLFYVTVEAEYDIVSAADGSKHTARVFGEAMDSGDKATNKAISAAYKYMAMQVFCIPTEGDNDADASTPDPVVPQVVAPTFNPADARAKIKALPHATDADSKRADALDDKASLGALYKEIAGRKDAALQAA